MYQVASRDLPIRHREVRGEDVSSYHEMFPSMPPMPADVELALVRRMKDGDRTAEEELTRQYAGIGIAMALRFRQGSSYEGADLDDLVSAGLLGVVEGVRHYEEGRGSRVSTCVYLWVRAQLRRTKHRQRFITYPQAKGEFLVKMQQGARIFFNSVGRSPTQKELSEGLETSVEYMARVLKESAETTTYSVDTGVRGRDGVHNAWTDDFMSKDQESIVDLASSIEELKILMEAVEDDLGDRESSVIRARFLQSRTLDSIGEELSLSKERVRQIEAKALRKLRVALTEKLGV